MKIAYCGYDFFFSCFERIINLGHEPVAVFSFDCDPANPRYSKVNFNNRLATAAREAGVRFTTAPLNALGLHELLSSGCEFLVSAGYRFRIPIETCPALRGCNVHPTILPEGRGPWPLPYLILKNIRLGGVTIHKLISKLDSGDILCQEGFPITPIDNLETVSCRAQMLAARLLDHFLRNFDRLWQNARPQGEGSYWREPTLEDRTIDWSMGVDSIMKIVRAFGKFESCATFGGKDWVIRDAVAWKENHSILPGTVAHEANREVVVAASDGFVCLRYYDLDPDWERVA